MGRKRTSGITTYQANSQTFFKIDKVYNGKRIFRRGLQTIEEAERYIAKCIKEIDDARLYGVRPERSFKEAALRFVEEKAHKRSIHKDIMHLSLLDKYIGQQPLHCVHNGTLQPFIEARKKDGVKNKTINLALEVVRTILNMAAREWQDEHGLSWLQAAPKIRLLPVKDARPPKPLSWEEQDRLFSLLPEHLREMATYKVNVGCREQEVCQLQWDWERYIPELDTSIFIIPGELAKNGLPRIVVLNAIAKAVIERQRGKHDTFVFTYKGKPIKAMNNTAWQNAVEKSWLSVRVHDLKHTIGKRLRAAGVSDEDRKDILGHKSRDITTHYSAAEISKLIEAVNKLCCEDSRAKNITFVKVESRKTHTLDSNVIPLKVANA